MTLGKDKVRFLNTPTPLHRLFLKDALDQGASMLLTVGGAQTNHGRLTAAAAAKYGLKSAIVAVDAYPGELSANLLLDGIMDCHVYLAQKPEGQDTQTAQDEAVRKVTEEWEAKGEKVYFIPMGGSNELGALGYYDCALELARQAGEMGLSKADPAGPARPRLFATVGSMGTYIGLASAIANEDLPLDLTGIGIMPYRDIRASATDYDYGAYNNPVAEVRQAIYYMGRMEGIILDPCYTGKTFNGILQMLREGRIDRGQTLIMLHTGGVPGIYTSHHRIEMEKELIDHIHII